MLNKVKSFLTSTCDDDDELFVVARLGVELTCRRWHGQCKHKKCCGTI